jgi:phosphoenolpyruvate-protein kinase (PTS system EI component)
MTGPPCNVTLSGLAVSPGLAVGHAFVYRDILHDLERYDIATHQVEYEHARIERAVGKVLADLGRSAERVEAELNTDLALIFRAHEAMLCDPALTTDLREELEQELVNAEQVVKRVFRRWERRFRAMPSEEVRDRGERSSSSPSGCCWARSRWPSRSPSGSALANIAAREVEGWLRDLRSTRER